jgi:hypothetical protein
MADGLIFGQRAEWEQFVVRNEAFMEHSARLHALINRVLGGTQPLEEPIDKLVYALGRIAVDEFYEIVTTAANGYGIAALKLLRPLFEKTVTMKYLIRHPDKVDDFLDYTWVSARKAMIHATGNPTVPVTEARRAEVEAKVAEIRHRYLEVVCKPCKRTRLAGNWTLIDLASMAREVGLGRGYLGLCYLPTLQIHTTLQGLQNWMEETEAGVTIATKQQHNQADVALLGAHTCLSLVLEEHVEHFGLGVAIDEIRDLYTGCWPGAAEALKDDTPADDVLEGEGE